MSDATATITGNLAGDPELRHTASGRAVANFSVAVNRGHHDRQAGTWVEDDPLFVRCVLWGESAENMVESFRRGHRITVIGDLVPNSWEDKDTGKRRTSIELTARDVAGSVKFSRVKPVRVTRDGEPDGSQVQRVAAAATVSAVGASSGEPAF